MKIRRKKKLKWREREKGGKTEDTWIGACSTQFDLIFVKGEICLLSECCGQEIDLRAAINRFEGRRSDREIDFVW